LHLCVGMRFRVLVPTRRGRPMRPQRRDAALLVAEDRREELLSGERTRRVATLDASGQPHTTAMGFVGVGWPPISRRQSVASTVVVEVV
jgi:hypothetical protein